MNSPKRSFLATRRAFNRIHSRALRSTLLFLIASVIALGTYTIVLAAPTILATMTAAFIGGDGDGKADPGETIEYTAVIQNNGADPATGVTFNDIIDTNTTLVAGSINVSPVAINDSYDTIGNTLLEVGVIPGTAPAVIVAGNVFANDAEFLTDAGIFSITSHTNPANGTLIAFNNASGTFSYLPNAGYTGADTFTYTLTDSGGLTDTATVTINVTSQRVWYVKNNAAVGGAGRSTDPFATLIEAQNASAVNDTIYVFTGDGTATGQNAGISLKNGQRFLGEGVALTVPVSVNGGANPTTLRAAGSQPLIDNTGGSGVALTDISNVQIFGLNIAGSTNAVNVTTTAANSGGFELANSTIRSAGTNGVDVNGGGSGTLTVSIHDITVTAAGNAIDILRTAGAIDITAFNNIVVSGNTGGTGINILGPGVTFDSIPGSTFQTITGGTTSIGASGNGVGASGMVLTNVSGDLSFTDLDIFADGGSGLRASGTAAYTGSAGFQIAVGAGVATVTSTGGPAVDLNTVRANNLTFVSISSTNSPTTGVALNSLLGSFSAGAGSNIANVTSAAGTSFQVGSSNAVITYDGTINATTGKGIDLTNNTGSTISFTGTMTLSTGINTAFNATGGGTISATNTASTLTTTTAAALNVANTIIGSGNLTFKSISSNGSASGIVLNSTGTSGGLVVVGDGGSTNNNSGGTIQNTTGHGISLTTTQGVSLDQMNIQNTGGSGINGTDVTIFTFTNGTINSSGNALGESNIAFNGNGTLTGNNLDGTLTVTGSSLTNAFDHGIHVESNDGTISNAIIQNNTITSSTSTATSKGSGIQLIGTGSASTVANLTQATINGNTVRNFPSGAGIQVNFSNANATGPGTTAGVAGSGTNIINITNNVARGFDATNRFGTSAIIFAVSGGNSASRSQGNFNVSNNGTLAEPIGNSLGIALGVGNNGFSNMTATINNNVIVANNTVASGGISGGNGVVIGCAGGRCETPLLTLTVSGNTISQTDGNGILLVGRGNLGTANLGIRNNNVAAPLTGVRPGIRVDAGNATAGSDDAICLDISGNTSGGSGGHEGIGLRKQGTVTTTHDFSVEGMAATASPGVENFVGNTGLNPGAANGSFGISGVLLISATSGFSNCTTIAMQEQGQQISSVAESTDNQSISQSDLTVSVSRMKGANALTSAPASMKHARITSENTVRATVNQASNSMDGGKPLFVSIQSAPAFSGETVNVSIGNLPAGEAVTIKFRVTVNDPLSLGTTQISNQGTVSGGNFASVLTDDPSVGGVSDPTVVSVDRPDTTIVSLNRVSGSPTGNPTVTWQVVFANPIDGLTASNFALVNTGLGGAPVITGITEASGPPSTTWNITATTGTGQGTLGLNLVNDTNLSHDVTPLPPFIGEVYTIDHIAPAVTIDQAAGQSDPSGSSPINFTVVFNEAVTGFADGDVTLSGTAGATTNTVTEIAPNDGTTYNVAVSGMTTDGTVIANIAINVAQDLAGNNNAASTSSDNTVLYDATAPEVTIDQAAAQVDPTNSLSINFTVVFSEAVTGFADGDVTLSGTAGATTDTITEIAPNNGTTYNVAVSGMTGNGTVIATIDAGVAQDVASKPNNASTSTDNTVTYDGTSPTVTINQAAGQADPTAGSPINFTVVFSEDVIGFNDPADVTLSGTAGATTIAISGGPITYNVAVSGMSGNGTVIASIPAGAAADATTNLSSASASTDNTVNYDTSAPTVTIDQAAGQPDPAGTAPINFTVVFSKSVTGFDNSADVDLSASTTLGTLSAVITGGPTTYNVAVSGMTGDGTVIASIPAGVAQDAATNGNSASTSTDNSVLYDTISPNVTINQAVGQVDPTNTSPINLTVIFSEAVSGFTTGDVTLGSPFVGLVGTVTEIAPLDGTTYRVAVAGMSGTGTITATIEAGVATDLALRPNNASTSTDNTVTFDDIAPTSNITGNPTNPSNSANASFTFTSSDNGTGVASLACALDGGPFIPCTSPQSYTSLSDGSHNFQVRAIDQAGNVQITPGSYTWVVDAIAPDTTITSSPVTPTNSTSANFSFTGNDGSGTGVAAFECKLDAAVFASCTSPTSYIGLLDGSHTFQVRSVDNVGNVDATPASFTWTVDTARPSVVVSSITTSPTNISPISVTITFSEPVTGFTPSVAAGDIVIGGVGGVDSNPVGSGTTYTFDLTPSGNGAVTVQVPDGSAQDTATNSNTVSNTFSITYDAVNPTVTIEQAAGQSDPADFSPVNFTVVFNESVSGFATGDVDLSGTAGATTGTVTEIAPNDGTTYRVAVSGMTTTGTVIASIPASVAQDSSANNNDASTSTDNTVAFNYDSTQPTVVSSLRVDPSPTNLASVDFTITFSEDVTGVDISDFGLTTTSVVSGTAVSGVSGSGSIYTVTVSTGSGNGTIRLDVTNDGSIQDVSLNSLGADFTTGEVYTVIKVATFDDVPLTNWASSYIERLYIAGFTGGCSASPLIYCPDGPVTRSQLAILLLRGIHGAAYTPPAVGASTGFNDVATTHWAAAWIKQLAAEGITSGCGGGNYCPETPASRAQVAILLVRAVHGISYVPPTATGIFADVPIGSFGADYIEQLVTDGITGGCSAGNFCPGAIVNRDQMAVFLVRAFNLP